MAFETRSMQVPVEIYSYLQMQSANTNVSMNQILREMKEAHKKHDATRKITSKKK